MKSYNKIFIGSLLGLLLMPSVALAETKEETVYANLKSNGTVYNTNITNHIYLDKNKSDIKDETLLKNIMNLNGDEKHTVKNNNIVWENKGNDIFYTGVYEKSLPIQTKITYYFNGKKVNPKKVLNKKGNVKIVVKFTNNLKQSNGLYTPFVVTLGTILNTKDNKNITIVNGRSINTGNKNIIMGVSSPGLEKLGLSELSNMNKIVISYSTTKFNIDNMYIMANPKLLSNSDLNIFDKLEIYGDQIDLLQTCTNKIEDGSKELSTNLSKVNDGVTLISNKLIDINNKMDALVNGSTGLSEGLLTINKEIDNTNKELSSMNLAKQAEDLKMLKATNTAQSNSANKMCIKLSIIFANNNIPNEFLELSEEEFLVELNKMNLSDQDKQQMVLYYNMYKLSYSSKKLSAKNNEAIDSTLNVISSIPSKIQTLSLKLPILYNGSKSISDNMNKLKTGINIMSNKSIELKTGTEKIYDGSKDLSNGISLLNSTGINKISNIYEQGKKITSKVKELKRLSSNYKGFSNHNSNNTSFVLKVDSVK